MRAHPSRMVLAVAALALALTALASGSGNVWAQDRGQLPPPSPPPEPVKPLYSKSYALVIGIDTYTNGWSSLSKAVEDAEAVADVLKAQGFDVQLRTSAQEDPKTGKKILMTREKIEGALEEFFRFFSDDDQARAVVWFAGHGASVRLGSGALGYLIGADAPNPRSAPNAAQRRVVEQQMQRRSVFMEQIESYVRQSNAKHVMLVFDSCFAGTIFQDRPRAEELPRTILESAKAPLRFAITSGSADQTVPDDGNFRRVFLRALAPDSPADTDRNGFVTGMELDSYLRLTLMDVQKRPEKPQSGFLRLSGPDRGDIVFQIRPDAVIETGVLAAPVAELHGRFWSFVRDENSDGLINRYVGKFPETPHREAALQAAEQLRVVATASADTGLPAPPPKRKELRVFIGTNRPPEVLTEGEPRDAKSRQMSNSQRAQGLSLGYATVSIPSERQRGQASRPTGTNLIVTTINTATEDPQRHFVIRARDQVPTAEAARNLLASIRGNEARDALVFVHGYNTSTSDAVYVAAQVATDVGFNGVTAVFAWPSSTSATAYLADRDAASLSAPYFRDFLDVLARDSGITRVHIIAQGMGSVPVLNNFRTMAGATDGARYRIGEVVTVGPDMPDVEFNMACAAVKPVVRGVTAYLSRNDVTAAAARRITASVPRAADFTQQGPVIGPCADRIDITPRADEQRAFSSNPNAFAASAAVLADIAQVLGAQHTPPPQRAGDLKPDTTTADGSTYWRLGG